MPPGRDLMRGHFGGFIHILPGRCKHGKQEAMNNGSHIHCFRWTQKSDYRICMKESSEVACSKSLREQNPVNYKGEKSKNT